MIIRRLGGESIWSILQFELVVTQECRTLLIMNDEVTELASIEADTRLILVATKSTNDVVIRSAATDDFILMCYAQKEMNIDKWMMMIDKETCVDIQDIRSHLGNEICAKYTKQL